MPTTRTGQRPQINSKDSSGWSWPRLKPITEQQTRTAMADGPIARSSKERMIGESKDQNLTPEPMPGSLPLETPLIPPSPGISAPDMGMKGLNVETDQKPSPAGVAGENNSEATSNIVLKGTNEHGGLLQPVAPELKHDLSSEMNEQVPDSDRLEPKPSTNNTHPFNPEGGQDPHSEKAESINSGRISFVEPDLDSIRSKGSSKVIRTRGSSIRDDLTSRSAVIDHSDKEPHVTGQPNVHANMNQDTSPNVITARRLSVLLDSTLNNETKSAVEDESGARGQLDESLGIRRETLSKIVGDLLKGEVQVPQALERRGTEVPLEEKPETPTISPVSPVMDNGSAPSDPIPYYANPKIMVHRPSQSFESDTSGPRTIDQVLAKERGTQLSDAQYKANEKTPVAPVSSFGPRPIDTPTGAGVHRIVKVKKSSLYLRKVRNAAARQTILKMTLGRQLAAPTKQALRQLARGELVIDEPPLETPSS